MLQYNTMRYGTDEFAFNKQSLLISKLPLDTTGQTSIEGFTISGAQPTDTDRRILFRVDDGLYKFNGQTPELVSGDETFSTVFDNGNTVDELLAVTDIPSWLDKKIYPLIALYAPTDAAVMPSIKLALKVRSSTDIYEKSVETQEISLTSTGDAIPRIVEIQTVTNTTGNGAVQITARVQNNGEWGNYVPTSSLKDVDATAIQFKIRYTVSIIGGGDSARVDKIVVRHTTGTATVSGDNAEIYSVRKDYEYPLKTCSVTVKHARLIDSIIKAYVHFGNAPKTRTFLPIGVSSGLAQTLTLGENSTPDANIDQSTLRIYANGNPVTNFSYNTETGEVSINLDADLAVTASYNYEVTREVWREMTIDVDQQPMSDGKFLTRFTYALPDEEQNGQTVTNIRLELLRTSGVVTEEILGIANGLTQQFILKHAALAETLNVNAQFSYDDVSQIVTCIGTSGDELKASYDWLGETHTLYSWAAAWSPAI